MKTIQTISSTLGYTIDTYGQFDAGELLDADWGDNTEFDNVAFVADLANYCAEFITEACKDYAGFEISVVADGSYSPREYNFSTDEAELSVRFEADKLMEYILKNKPAFEQYLKDTFTSVSGFHSYVPDNWAEFYAELKELDGQVDSDRDWAVMLGWYLKRAVLTEEEYLDQMYEVVRECAYNHASNLKEEEA